VDSLLSWLRSEAKGRDRGQAVRGGKIRSELASYTPAYTTGSEEESLIRQGQPNLNQIRFLVLRTLLFLPFPLLNALVSQYLASGSNEKRSMSRISSHDCGFGRMSVVTLSVRENQSSKRAKAFNVRKLIGIFFSSGYQHVINCAITVNLIT